ncbi:hypothetical protein [Haloarchaeobius sp. TZWWS8]|uniref:hypothetical protein n=1 Tax=Haloarchaeobius sp. TZWWS8 TaxID=3446121 RepID=UPI003EBEFC24
MTDASSIPASCNFCDRRVARTALDECHSLRVHGGDGADIDQLACPHCFDEIAALTDDMEPRELDDSDAAALAAESCSCSLCGNDAAVSGGTLLVADDTAYALCSGCTDVFDQFCANVPEVEPAEETVGDVVEGEAEAASDAGSEAASESASATAETVETVDTADDTDSSDLGTVLESGLDDVEFDDEVRFDIRRESREGDAVVFTVEGSVDRAETSYIGGSTVYVAGDDGETYRLESSFSSEAVRVGTVDGHDVNFKGHLDELVRIE